MDNRFRNVFVLNVGRSGSKTFALACAHITNYSSGHETRSWEIGETRLEYLRNHIEVDNKLTWMLGSLDKKYGNEAYYVHLIRNRTDVIRSWDRLWNHSFSNIRFFSEGVLSNVPDLISQSEKSVIGEFHYDVANQNIELFLKDKPNAITVRFEDIENGFSQFWSEIGAEGNLEKALAEFKVRYNAELGSDSMALNDAVFRKALREKIFLKRINEAPSAMKRLKLKFQLMLFKMTGLHSDLF
jgi:hypothetical protein